MRVPHCLQKLKKKSTNRWENAELILGSVGKWKNLRELMLEIVETGR